LSALTEIKEARSHLMQELNKVGSFAGNWSLSYNGTGRFTATQGTETLHRERSWRFRQTIYATERLPHLHLATNRAKLTLARRSKYITKFRKEDILIKIDYVSAGCRAEREYWNAHVHHNSLSSVRIHCCRPSEVASDTLLIKFKAIFSTRIVPDSEGLGTFGWLIAIFLVGTFIFALSLQTILGATRRFWKAVDRQTSAWEKSFAPSAPWPDAPRSMSSISKLSSRNTHSELSPKDDLESGARPRTQ
jgi:hypothetical protein